MRLIADENFDNKIVRAIRKHYPDTDIVRVQDTDIYQAEDPIVLEWAAKEQRILLTHDVKTMTKYAYERIEADLPMPGVIEIKKNKPLGQVIEELLVFIGASEWENQVVYLPM